MAIDPSTSLPYYFNKNTGQTQWEPPANFATANPEAQAALHQSPGTSESTTTPSRSEHVTKSSAEAIAVAASSETSQQLPSHQQVLDERAADNDHDEDTADIWEVMFDEDKGIPLFLNTRTGKVQTDVPAVLQQEVEEQEAEAEAEAEPELPAGWQKAVDPESGQPYYFNSTIGKSKRNHK